MISIEYWACKCNEYHGPSAGWMPATSMTNWWVFLCSIYDLLILNPKEIPRDKEMARNDYRNVPSSNWVLLSVIIERWSLDGHVGTRNLTTMSLRFQRTSRNHKLLLIETLLYLVLWKRERRLSRVRTRKGSDSKVTDLSRRHNCSVLTQQCTHNPERLWSWAGQHSKYNVITWFFLSVI